jgi:hypothetical protein
MSRILLRVNKQMKSNSVSHDLYAELDRADSVPTPAQAEAVKKIEKDFSAVVKQWDELKSQDLAALNRQLRSANHPEIHPDSHRQSDEGEDQDID